MANIALLYSHQVVKNQVENNQQHLLINDAKLLAEQVPGLAAAVSIADPVTLNALQEKISEFAELWPQIQLDEQNLSSGQMVTEIEQQWLDNITVINSASPDLSALREQSEGFITATTTLQALMDEAINLMVTGNEGAQQVYLASLQLAYIERMGIRLHETIQGGIGGAKAANDFARLAAAFRDNLNRLLGRGGAGRQAVVTNPTAIARLNQVDAAFTPHEKNIPVIIDGAAQFFQVQDAVTQIAADSQSISRLLDAIAAQYRQAAPSMLADDDFIYPLAAIGTALLIMAFMPALFGLRSRVQKANAFQREVMQQSESQDKAVLRLLDDIEPLQDGDLTTMASVDDAFTGTIADAINYSVETLRDLVTAINSTSTKLSGNAQKTASATSILAEISRQQAKDTGDATESITMMAQSMKTVSAEAGRSAEVAQNSVAIAHKGGETVRSTIRSMDGIREQIQETAKRLKRLSESSQEVGDIVGLINDIADQTNLLALNAAIQASSAGEAGRGFAVIADEVQRLAERSATATKRVESLVTAIQANTNEAVTSMEHTTSEVVAGTERAEDAGTALDEIEKVSGELAQLIHNISRTASEHAENAAGISESMTTIQDAMRQTSTETSATSESISKLAMVAEDLKQQVSGFRLPS